MNVRVNIPKPFDAVRTGWNDQEFCSIVTKTIPTISLQDSRTLYNGFWFDRFLSREATLANRGVVTDLCSCVRPGETVKRLEVFSCAAVWQPQKVALVTQCGRANNAWRDGTKVGLVGGNSHRFLFPLLPEQTLSHGAALDGGANCSFLCRKLSKHVEPHFSMWLHFFFQNFLPVVALHFQAFDIAHIVHKFPLDHINPDHGNGIACSFVCLNRWSPTDLPIIRQAGFQFPISAECTFHQNFYHLFFASTFLPLVLWVKISIICILRLNFYPFYFASKFLPLVLSCTLYQHADTYAFL